MKNFIVVILSSLFFISIHGCLPFQKIKTVESPVKAPSLSVLIPQLDDKINHLNRLIDKQGLSEEDRKILFDLLEGYRQLRSLAVSQPTETEYADMIKRLYANLDRMDGKYFMDDPETLFKQTSVMTRFSLKREEIIDAYIAGDHERVIALCMELAEEFGNDAILPDIGSLFAISLAGKGRFEDAISIGEVVSKSLEHCPDLIWLNIRIAEWQLKQGRNDTAARIYEKLVDLVDEKEIELQFLHRKISATRHAGGENQDAGPGKNQAEAAETPVDQLMLTVEKLLEDNRFSEARALVMQRNTETLSPSEMEKIHGILKKIEAGEEDYLEDRLTTISGKQDMAQARTFLEDERFEDAIPLLEAMASENPDNLEIKELIRFAVEKLINRERNRAAQLFLAAKKTQAQAEKMTYLRDCLDILNQIYSRYPESGMTGKLASDIKTVEDELKMVMESSAAP